MHIIPVIDVRLGCAVRARRGNRADYRPLEPSSDPADVLRRVLSIYPFRTVYLADLDGIEGRGANLSLPGDLCSLMDCGEVWVDDGHVSTAAPQVGLDRWMSGARAVGAFDGARVQEAAPHPASAPHPHPLPASGERGQAAIPSPRSFNGERVRVRGSDWHNASSSARERSAVGIRQVVGSESLDALHPIAAGDVLSLDFRGDDFVGPEVLLASPQLWPERIIVMTLARIGAGDGPDFARLSEIKARAGGRAIYAAGGVRHIDDLRKLQALGIHGALIASALHDGQIKTGDLEEIAGESF